MRRKQETDKIKQDILEFTGHKAPKKGYAKWRLGLLLVIFAIILNGLTYQNMATLLPSFLMSKSILFLVDHRPLTSNLKKLPSLWAREKPMAISTYW